MKNSPQKLSLGYVNYFLCFGHLVGRILICALCTGTAFGHITNTVVAWGQYQPFDLYDATNVPPNLTNVVAIAAGYGFTLALKTDHTVVGWGNDVYSMLIDIPPGLTNVVAIAAGYDTKLALIDDGTVVAWGYSDSATNFPPGLSNVVAIAAGADVALALKGDGTVVAWGGYNDYYYGATNVPSGLSNVVAIALDGNAYDPAARYSLALKADGTVTDWGYGDEDANIVQGLSNVVAIATGGGILALKEDGTIVSDSGENVPPGLTNVTAIAPGMALLGNETVSVWVEVDQTTDPTNIPSNLTNVVAIAAGYDFDVALVRDGFPVVLGPVSQFAYSGAPVLMIASGVGAPPLTYQWQFNGTNLGGATTTPWSILPNAQLANAGNYDVVVSNDFGVVTSSVAGLVVSNSPPIFLSQPANIAVPLGDNPSISVNATGSRPLSYQWQFNGVNISGATNAVLGLSNVQQANGGYYSVVVSNPYGTNVSSSASLSFVLTSVVAWGSDGAIDVPPGLTNVIAVAAGGASSLALNAEGTVVAWGVNTYGQTNVPSGLSNVVAVATDGNDNYALKSDGTVMYWGYYYQTNVVPGLTNTVAIAVGGGALFALKADGTVAAWNDGANLIPPTNIPPGLTNVVAIAAGGIFGAALKNDQTVVAWGVGDTSNVNTVTNVPSNFTNLVTIGASPDAGSFLAVMANGTVQLVGNYGINGSLVLPSVLTNVVAISASEQFAMALKTDHTVIAWGDNHYGEVDVPSGLTNVIAIATGSSHAVVLDPAGGVITISVGFGGSGQKAYLITQIGPPGALAAGGAWMANGAINVTDWTSNSSISGVFSQPEKAAIIFKQIPGWNLPPSQNVQLTLGTNTVVSATYTPIPPLLLANAADGINLIGTSGTTYRVEYSTNLVSGQWLPLTTNTLGAGISTILPGPPTNGPAAFYRAVWLP